MRASVGRAMASVPVRLRVTLAFAGVMAILLAAAGVALYTRLASELDTTINQGLHSRTVDLLPAARSGRPLPPDDEQNFARVVRAADQLPDLGEPVRVVRTRLDAARTLVVGTTIDDRDDALKTLVILLVIGGPIMLVLASLAGYGAAAAALRPVERDAPPGRRDLGAEPGARLPVPPADDEIGRLGTTLNAMLDRIEDGVRARARRSSPTPATSCARRWRSSRPSSSWRCARGRSAEELRGGAALGGGGDRPARRAGRGPARARARRPGAAADAAASDARRRRAARRRAALRAPRAEQRPPWRSTPPALRSTRRPAASRAGARQPASTTRCATAAATIELRGRARRRRRVRAARARRRARGSRRSSSARAFERFTRADAARGRGGAGLGLAIVAAIAAPTAAAPAPRNRPGGGADVWTRWRCRCAS